MNTTQSFLLKLLSASIRGQEITIDKTLKIDWELLYKEALAHQIHTIIFENVNKLTALNPPRDIIDKWRRITQLSAIHQIQMIEEANLVLKELIDAGIKVILLKGIMLRDLYPQPEYRTMGDIDILVSKSSIDECTIILENMEFKYIKHDGPLLLFVNRQLNLELHYQLFEDKRLLNFDSVDNIISHAIKINTESGLELYALSLEDNLLYLLTHMYRHIYDGGIGLRQFCDLVLYVEKHYDLIDWDVFLQYIKNNKLEQFTTAVFMLCQKYLGLTCLGNCLAKIKIDQDTIELLLDVVLASGVFGRKETTNGISNTIARRTSLENSTYYTKSKYLFSFIAKFAFPSIDNLSKKYSYAKKHKYLLPIAWIHRGTNVIIRTRSNKESVIKIPFRVVKSADKRSKLLKGLGMLK